MYVKSENYLTRNIFLLEHCGADFAPPKKDGTEIFEAVETLQV